MNITRFFVVFFKILTKLILIVLFGNICQVVHANEWVGIFEEELRADISPKEELRADISPKEELRTDISPRSESSVGPEQQHPQTRNPCETVWFAIIGKSKRGESFGEFYSRFRDQKRCKLSAPTMKLKLTLFGANPKDRCSSSDIAFGGMIYIDGRIQKELDGTPKFFEGRIEDHRFRKTLPGCFPKAPGFTVNFDDSAIPELPIRLRSGSLQKSTSPHWPGNAK